jgi:protein-tyrosine phosphatase
MMSFSQILEELYMGSHPETLEGIENLKSLCGITVVLNPQTAEDLVERGLDWSTLEACCTDLDISTQRIQMRDFDYEDQRRTLPDAVKTLARLLSSGQIVYLHCNAGQGRSLLVAMAYLYWCCGLSSKDAVKHVKERRVCSPTTELLEIVRQDLLGEDKLCKYIALRAYKLWNQRGSQASDPFCDWIDAEKEILKKILCYQ